MTRVVFLDPAEEEMLEAAAYYEDRAGGLGDHFIAEVQHAVQRIMENPESSRVIKGEVRRRLLRRFPFGILYRIENELWEKQTINPETSLWTEGWSDWRPAEEIFGQVRPATPTQTSSYQQTAGQPLQDISIQPSTTHGEKKDLSDRTKEQSDFDFFAWLIPYKNPPALIAYYFAVFSIVPLFSIFLGIPAVILGVKGLKKRSKDPTIMGAVHAWFGIICGGLFSLLGVAMIVAAIVGIAEATKAANP